MDLTTPPRVPDQSPTVTQPPLAGAKDIRRALRPRIERELCAVGGTLRRKVEAEYQSALVAKYRDLKRRQIRHRQKGTRLTFLLA